MLAAASCVHVPPQPGSLTGHQAPGVDSVTTALWHMDEPGGARVADSGPFRLDGTAGLDARTEFGRFKSARHFVASVNSFVYVPANPVYDGGASFTIEAWINLDSYGDYEDTPIAAHWSPAGTDQSWIFTIIGRNSPSNPGLGDHRVALGGVPPERLAFVFQPEAAGGPRAYYSNRAVPVQRWTHVAATYDGQVVRLFIDGLLDAQFASPGKIRPSAAPLFIGNAFDPRWLTNFSGTFRVDPNYDQTPYYAFQGVIDELRISSAARREFPWAQGQ
jgi:hypothetical protein